MGPLDLCSCVFDKLDAVLTWKTVLLRILLCLMLGAAVGYCIDYEPPASSQHSWKWLSYFQSDPKTAQLPLLPRQRHKSSIDISFDSITR